MSLSFVDVLFISSHKGAAANIAALPSRNRKCSSSATLSLLWTNQTSLLRDTSERIHFRLTQPNLNTNDCRYSSSTQSANSAINMSEHYYSTDPCSLTYMSPGVDHTTSVRSMDTVRNSHRAKLRKVRVAFVRSVKRLFGIKSRRSSSFIMPYDYNKNNKRLNRSSMRSRPSPTKITDSSSPVPIPFPIPSICLTGTSTRRCSHYRVHSYGGAGSRPMAERNTVRFSHPVVSSTILPAPKSSPALLGVAESAEKDGERSRRTSNATDDSVPTSSQRDSGPQPVRPKSIWRWSAQSVTTDGLRESYSDFKNRLDGHRPRADRQSNADRPPSLQFIPRMPTIKLHDDEIIQTKSAVKEAAEIEKHRSDALNSLEGFAPQSTQDRYVLAILPKNDLPITAVQISSDQYPLSLIPGGVQQTRPAMQRSHTFSGLASTEQIYQAYTPSSSPPMCADANQPSATKLSAKRKGKMATHFESEELLDLPKFDTAADPDFNARHSLHYRNVESGVFDDMAVTPVKLHAPTPSSFHNSEPQIIAESSFLLSPTPPSSTEKTKQAPVKADRKKVIPRKLVLAHTPVANVSKPLPPTPGPRSSSKHVTPISMNANGYPNITAHPSKRFSAEPKYQHRSVDAVEAKYIKERPKKSKKPKTVSKTSKSDVGPNKLKKKSLTEQDSQKLAELNALDDQLKKLMCV